MSKFSCKIRSSSGFTLVEVVVVVAIALLLLVLLFPALEGTLLRAERSKSAANLRTLSNGLFLYSNDNGGSFPPVAITVKTTKGGWEKNGVGSWDGFILPYLFPDQYFNVGNPKSYYDKVRSSQSLFNHANDHSEITIDNAIRRTYAMPHNHGMLGVATWSGHVIRLSSRLTAIPRPAETILLTEKPGYDGNTLGRTGAAGVQSAQQQIDIQPNLNGTENSFNYLFADGHVEFLNVEDTIGNGSLTSSKGFWTLDPDD